eukprot:2341376-Rhodomonas_salina.3
MSSVDAAVFNLFREDTPCIPDASFHLSALTEVTSDQQDNLPGPSFHAAQLELAQNPPVVANGKPTTTVQDTSQCGDLNVIACGWNNPFTEAYPFNPHLDDPFRLDASANHLAEEPEQEVMPAAKPRSRQTKKPAYWSKDEHEMFLQGLIRFGAEDGLGPDGAELIAMFLGNTRTVLQVRSHAQKYFLKMRSCQRTAS